MNAIVKIEAQAPDLPVAIAGIASSEFQAWLAQGHDLYRKRSDLDWQCADWLCVGQEKFPEQMKLALAEFASDPIEQKSLTRAAKVAALIPASHRNTALTFEHHEHVADLPMADRLNLLAKAAELNWSARRLRLEAMGAKVASGQIQVFTDDDWQYQAMTSLAAKLNRAPFEVRTEFVVMALTGAKLPDDMTRGYKRWLEQGQDYLDAMQIEDVEA